MNKKIVAIVLVLILIVNLVLYGMRIIDNLVFWAIIIVIAIITYMWFRKDNINKGKGE